MIAKLNQAGVPCGPVLNLAQVFADPQVQHSEMAIEVEHPGYSTVKTLGFRLKLSDTPCSVRHPAPELGAGTEAVLRQLAYRDEEIAELRDRGVI